MQLEKGKAFRGFSDTSPKKEIHYHLRIVISNMAINGRALTIPISTIHNQRYDNSCILKKGEHEFLTEEESYAFYAKAEAICQKDIDELERMGKLIEYENVSKELLKRLQEGAKKSDFLPKCMELYFDEF